MEQAGAKEGKEEGEKVPQIKKKKLKEGGKMKNCLTRTVFGYSVTLNYGGFLPMERILPNPHDGGEGEKKEKAFGGTGWENAPVHLSVHPGPRRET